MRWRLRLSKPEHLFRWLLRRNIMKKQKLISVAIIIIGWALPLVSWAGYREYSCDEQEDIPATEENCKACGSSRRYSDGMCIFAKCSAGKIQGEIEGTGEPGCFDCSEPATILTTSNACNQCIDANGTPTRTQRQSGMFSGKVDCSLKECPADTFRSKSGACIPCDSSTGATATKAQCDTCPGREYDTTYSFCHLSTVACRDRDGYLTSDGDCAACTSTDEYQILAGKESLCWSCSNARYLDVSLCKVPCPKGTVPGSTAANNFLQCRSCLMSEPMQTPYCGACPERVQTNIDNVEFCVLKTCGSDEFLTENGNCVPCDILAPQDTDATLCTCTNREMVNDQCVLKTCPDGKFRDQNGACFDCTVASNIPQTNETECAKCTNRESYAGYCIPRCATGTYRYSADECRSCDTVQEGTVTSNIQVCTDCGFTPTQITSNSSYVCRKTCPAGQFNGGDGQCYACDTINAVPTGPEACAVCGDVRDHQSGVCLLKTCPDGMFRGRKAGTAYDACYACDDTSGDITSDECTQKCRNTRILGKNNICYSCQELNPFDVADQTACEQCPNRTYTMTGECALSQCPDNHFSVPTDGSCYACDDTRNVIGSSDCVEKCGDQRILIGEYCAKACQPGEFRNGTSCSSCDAQTDTTKTTQAECEQCGDLREMVDGQCLFKCPDGQFRSKYGLCHQCTDMGGYSTTPTQCSRCNGTRTMKGEFCILTTCPDEYVKDEKGYFCVSCEDMLGATKYSNWLSTNLERACQECGLSWINDTCTKVVCTDTQFVGTDGRCHECSDQTSWPANSSQCAKCGSKRISIENDYGNANCILCDGTLENASLWYLDEATCTKCCRGTATYTDDGTCICGTVEEELHCPSGSFAGFDEIVAFQCFSCDISYDITLEEADPQFGIPPNHGEQECLACGNRSVVGSVCRLATCGTGEFWDATAGTCHKCTDTTSYPGVSQKTCESCPNRTYVSGYGKSFCVFSGN